MTVEEKTAVVRGVRGRENLKSALPGQRPLVASIDASPWLSYVFVCHEFVPAHENGSKSAVIIWRRPSSTL